MRQALSGIVSKSASSFKTIMILAVGDDIRRCATPHRRWPPGMRRSWSTPRPARRCYSSNADAPALSRVADQDDDALPDLRGAGEAAGSSKNTPVPFSAQAAAEPPTKLGVKAGGSVTVETAILSMVTKSANDSATALGELLGGIEEQFRPHDDRQGARARHERHRLPQRQRPARPRPVHHRARHGDARHRAAASIFRSITAISRSAPSYTARQRINGHNRLLGRIKGVDGIKTGYTRASGFNLVSSVSDGNRRIVAVVMGGTSGRSRDNQMAELINDLHAEGIDPRRRRSGRQGRRRQSDHGTGQGVPAQARRADAGRQADDDVDAVASNDDADVEDEQSPTNRRAAVEEPAPDRQGQRTVETGSTSPKADAAARHRRRRRSGQHRVRARPAGRSRSPLRQASPKPRPSSPRPTKQAADGPCRCVRLHRRFRQGRRDLLPRPLRRLRFEERRLERLQRPEEEEDRLLRRPAVGRRRERSPGNVSASKEN